MQKTIERPVEFCKDSKKLTRRIPAFKQYYRFYTSVLFLYLLQAYEIHRLESRYSNQCPITNYGEFVKQQAGNVAYEDIRVKSCPQITKKLIGLNVEDHISRNTNRTKLLKILMRKVSMCRLPTWHRWASRCRGLKQVVSEYWGVVI